MAYNEELAERMRPIYKRLGIEPEEKKMMGGLAFMVQGKMSSGIVKDKLMTRVIAEKYEEALQNPNARPMDFTGKVMKEFLFVNADGFVTETDLQHWIELGVEHAKHASSK